MTEQATPISGLDVPAPPPPADVPVIDADTYAEWAGKITADTAAMEDKPTAEAAEQAQQLERLLALYDQAEAEANEAAEKFDAVKAAVKSILYVLRPDDDTRKVQCRSSHLHAPLELVFVAGRKSLDRAALERSFPQLDLTPFEKVGKPSWTMRRGKITE